MLDQCSLDKAEQLSQWFSSPLYYYSSDWRESVSSWGPASFMTTCSPFRQRYFHGILSGPTAHVYWCLWLHIDFENLYFIVKRTRLAMLRYEFLGLPFKLSVLLFPSCWRWYQETDAVIFPGTLVMLLNPSMPVRQLSLLTANFAAHLESCTVRFKVHNLPLSPSEVIQPHFGCCICECFTPASSPGDLRLHVDTASLSLETG